MGERKGKGDGGRELRNRDAAYFTDTGSHSNAYTDGGEGGPWVSAKCWQTGSNAWKGRGGGRLFVGSFCAATQGTCA